jgi:hypothetical protein
MKRCGREQGLTRRVSHVQQTPKLEIAGSCFKNEKYQIHKTGTDRDTGGKKEKRSTQRNLETHNREN